MKIILCGKGGCGKSTVASLLSYEFAQRGKKVLVVDTDESNYGLHRQLGLPLPADFLEYFGGKKAFGNRDNSIPVFDRRWRTADIPAKYTASEGSISLMAIGKIHEAGEGCACSMGTLARCFLENLVTDDNEIIITDTEAGIEHFGRGVDQFADCILQVMDPSCESLRLSDKIYDMGIALEKPVFYILNKTSGSNETFIRSSIKHPDRILAVIPPEERILEDGLKGNALKYSIPASAYTADTLLQLCNK